MSIFGNALALASEKPDEDKWKSILGEAKVGKLQKAQFGFDALNAGVGAYLGFKQLGLATDSLDFQKKAFAENMANQSTLVNGQLRDRQAARIGGSVPGTYQSVGDYMRQNSVGTDRAAGTYAPAQQAAQQAAPQAQAPARAPAQQAARQGVGRDGIFAGARAR